EGRSAKVATASLEKQGFIVINIKKEEAGRWMLLNRALGGVSPQDKIFLTRNLHTMLEAGISIDQAISTTADQMGNLPFRAALNDIAEKLRSGQTLYRSLGLYPKYFSQFYVSLIKVGESS